MMQARLGRERAARSAGATPLAAVEAAHPVHFGGDISGVAVNGRRPETTKQSVPH